MHLNRRGFMAIAASAAAMPKGALAAPFVLRAEPVTARILSDGGGPTSLWGYNGTSPGPEIRARAGDLLEVVLENRLEEGTAVHWHGIRIVNEMDGVPYLTQPMVEKDAAFTYRFMLPDPGTYWYHSHNRSWEQVARGLYGPLIVEETAPPDVDHDITVVLDDWRIERDGTVIEDFGNRHDFSHAGRLGTYARALPSVQEVRRGDRVRLRLINAATARVFPLRIDGIDGKIVALDGMPLETPQDLTQSFLAPAQRMDVIADVARDVEFVLSTPQEPYALGTIKATGENPDARATPIAALPPHKIARPAVDAKRHVTLTMQGGAMGGAHPGDDIWSFNGVSGLPYEPWQRISKGETLRITLVNDTAFPHGIHLHGHHFYELDADGNAGALRDTTLLMRQQRRDILCRFDNPGKWLLHCHMLDHQAAGMKTWLEVV